VTSLHIIVIYAALPAIETVDSPGCFFCTTTSTGRQTRVRIQWTIPTRSRGQRHGRPLASALRRAVASNLLSMMTMMTITAPITMAVEPQEGRRPLGHIRNRSATDPLLYLPQGTPYRPVSFYGPAQSMAPTYRSLHRSPVPHLRAAEVRR
jgi:hypothetical protein